jgi:predicted membrane protein
MKQNRRNNGMFWGFILVIIGILFLLDNFYILDFGEIISMFWPVILIAIGIKMLLDRKKDQSFDSRKYESAAANAYVKGEKQDILSESNVFGDVVLAIKADNFTGGSVNNVFGDIRLDLSEIKPGTDLVKIFASGVFGDITVIAPAGLPLRVNANAVAGDISIKGNKKDGIFPNLNYQDDGYEQAKKKMAIQCSLVFGTVHVY